MDKIDEVINHVNSGEPITDDVLSSIKNINRDLPNIESQLDNIFIGGTESAVKVNNSQEFLNSLNKTQKGIDDGISQIDDAIKNAGSDAELNNLKTHKANLEQAKKRYQK